MDNKEEYINSFKDCEWVGFPKTDEYVDNHSILNNGEYPKVVVEKDGFRFNFYSHKTITNNQLETIVSNNPNLTKQLPVLNEYCLGFMTSGKHWIGIVRYIERIE